MLVRKDLTTLRNWESQRFWAAMIYLHIMPPLHKHPQTQNSLRFTEVYYTLNDLRHYEPLNRYDEFISSHATCCEHSTNYFGHYHRHLLVLFELALNEADISLRKRQVPEKFKTFEYNEIFQKVFDRYGQIIEGCKSELENGQQLPLVALHYWNPMNYNERIKFPEFLTQRQRQKREKTDPFWLLHQKYLKCVFGQKNYKHTWNSGQQFTYQSVWLVGQRNKVNFNSQEEQILNGNYKRNNQLIYSLPLLRRKIPQNRWNQAFDNTYRTGKTGLTLLSQEQLNIQYGGGQYHWFSYEELKQRFNYSSYNLSLPHYVYAQSLLAPNREFCAQIRPWGTYTSGFLTQFQRAHNQMHDYLSFPMMDGSFSIANPLFFVYHSFIDYMLELKIRLTKTDTTNSAYRSVVRFLNTEFTWRKNRSRSARNEEVRTILNIFSEDGKMQNFGDYPLLEWLDTVAIRSRFEGRTTKEFIQNQNYQSCKTYRQFMLDDKNKKIRQTYELKPFYEETVYDKVIQNYPFSYNYDILPLNVQGRDLIPRYVSSIMYENEIQDDIFVGKVASRVPTQSGEPKLEQADKLKLKKTFSNEEKEETKVQEANQLKIKVQNYNKEMQKIGNLYAYVLYPTNIKNQVVQLSLKIKDMQNFSFYNCKALSSDLEKKIKNSNGVIPIQAYTIFLRGYRSVICSKCKTKKFQIKNLLPDFKGYLYPFYIDLLVNSNYGNVYDENSDKIQKNFDELLQFRSNSTSKEFIFQNLQGSPQVTFHAVFVKNLNQENAQTINISDLQVFMKGYLYDVLAGQQAFCIQGQIEDKMLKFHRISDSTAVESQKVYLYKDFECTLMKEEKKKTCKFSLKNFNENGEYTIYIDEEMNVRIRDSHFAEKKKIIW